MSVETLLALQLLPKNKALDSLLSCPKRTLTEDVTGVLLMTRRSALRCACIRSYSRDGFTLELTFGTGLTGAEGGCRMTHGEGCGRRPLCPGRSSLWTLLWKVSLNS